MKVISIVGPKKSGKTLLVTRLIEALKKHGKVGTVKHMPDHAVEDKGDTRRHFEAGADVVVGVGKGSVQFKVMRDGGLESALRELQFDGVDFAVVEGFKGSDLPKIVLGGLDLPNCIEQLDMSQIDDAMMERLTQLVISLEYFDI